MGFIDKMNEKSSYSVASGNVLNMLFYRLLWKKFHWNEFRQLNRTWKVINAQASKGYRLHTITTASGASGGLLGKNHIQTTIAFEKIH